MAKEQWKSQYCGIYEGALFGGRDKGYWGSAEKQDKSTF